MTVTSARPKLRLSERNAKYIQAFLSRSLHDLPLPLLRGGGTVCLANHSPLLSGGEGGGHPRIIPPPLRRGRGEVTPESSPLLSGGGGGRSPPNHSPLLSGGEGGGHPRIIPPPLRRGRGRSPPNHPPSSQEGPGEVTNYKARGRPPPRSHVNFLKMCQKTREALKIVNFTVIGRILRKKALTL